MIDTNSVSAFFNRASVISASHVEAVGDDSRSAKRFSDYTAAAGSKASSVSHGNTMEESGVSVDQPAEEIWLGKEPNTKYADKFLKLSGMTLAEKIRFYYLEDRELTEGDLRRMDPVAREEIEAEILLLIEEAIEAERREDEKKGADDVPQATVDPKANYEFSAFKMLSSLQAGEPLSDEKDVLAEASSNPVSTRAMFTDTERQHEA